jgi:2-polyprenyl-6-methoxyphenol hydroxylase-like FAD-dependent oxidoreductase
MSHAADGPSVVKADVCIYGGTSGGVAAAVQASRMGKRAIIVEPGRHLGGMTSGGLSAVDIGDPRTVGGIAREYFTRLVGTYGKALVWDQPFKASGGPATGGAYSIEPHVAEQIFNDLAGEAHVSVYREARLSAVKKDGTHIRELVTEDGRIFRAAMFIDTTYEGDLMAKAGVSYTLTREGNAKYGESYNGIYYAPNFAPRTDHAKPRANGRTPSGQGVWDRDVPIDPYVIKGDPTSGLLQLIDRGEPGTPGDPAPGVQAYCFRLCLTTAPDRLPIAPPPDYDPKRYEVVARFIEGCQTIGDDLDLRWFSKYDALPNNKWDFNTATFGGNLPGASWEWPEATYARREQIAKEHENYHRGLLHFLATDPRVPAKVREKMQRFGLPRDEFADTGGWPHQLYIREARRMVSDLVMTEHHTFGKEIAPNSIGLGSYGTDTHEVRRIVKDGLVTREGKTATGRGGAPPYPIGYGAIVPKAAECENLFVTFALSASHTAFSSIRMEPVFMVTSQSAATAACLAIDDQVPVQRVDYTKLEKRLVADGQILAAPTKPKPAETAPIPTLSKPPGLDEKTVITLDDTDATYEGDWEVSSKLKPLFGSGYHQDKNTGRGAKTARFSATIPHAGVYAVRLLYTASPNRASNVLVTVHAQDGDHEVRVDERQECLANGLPKSLGDFHFTAGPGTLVTVSNKDANGFVVVDGLQILPAETAKWQRLDAVFTAGISNEGKKSAPTQTAKAVAVSPLAAETQPTLPPKADIEPVQLAKDTPALAIDGRHFDLVVIGGTASGVACAVRAAREGCSVLLVQHNGHIGGMLANGLMQWDALYGGPRAPLFTELLHNIEAHYIETFGKDSKDHQIMRFTHEHYPVGWVEPHVMERECHRLIAAERHITLLLSHYPSAVERDGATLKAVTLREYGTTNDIRVTAAMFADATYEGDLLALAKVPYRVGREARSEYGEPHAGKIFTNTIGRPAPRDAVEGRLNIRPYTQSEGTIDPDSPFSADGEVQAYNYRFCLSRDPANRMLPDKPANYDRDEFLHYDRKSLATNPGPNQKSHMNSPILPGENAAYPEASWPEREKIITRHRDFALGLMWFLQNDESVSEKQRAAFREWGLAKDEFPDNDHIPYEMYVREARRLVGRHVLTEQDNSVAPGLSRTPIMPDSIAITDWYMDSHACTKDSRPGYRYDGKLILTEESRPAQIPYHALLPQGVDNLLVPVCLSATHVAWGAIRLEPVWMATGEAAGYAAGLAKREGTTPAELDPDHLLRELADHRQMISFFNDLKVDAPDRRIPAVEYLATKGFFASYDARPNEPLSEPVAEVWAHGLADLRVGKLDSSKLAQAVSAADQKDAAPITADRFSEILLNARLPASHVGDIRRRLGPPRNDTFARGDVCYVFYQILLHP